MKLTSIFGLLAISCLAGAARAQGAITINLGSGWVVSQNFNTCSNSQFIDLTGSGSDVLHVNGFVDIGTSTVNRAQSNVQGVRNGATPLSASASASCGAPGGYMVFTKSGAPGTVTTSAHCTPSGVLPAQQSVNMAGTSTMTLTLGNYGFPNQPNTTSTAQVVPPSCSGKICSVYNRKILTDGGTITPTFVTNAFFYTLTGSASANCTLHIGDSAFFSTNVFADLTANLN